MGGEQVREEKIKNENPKGQLQTPKFVEEKKVGQVYMS
jgi:hypothetical protein